MKFFVFKKSARRQFRLKTLVALSVASIIFLVGYKRWDLLRLGTRHMFSPVCSSPCFEKPFNYSYMKKYLIRYDFWSERQVNRNKVVFAGDSILAELDQQLLDSYFGEKNVVNRSIGGETCAGLAFRLSEDIMALNPVCVVLLIGTNDIVSSRSYSGPHSSSPEDVAKDVFRIANTLSTALPNSRIIVLSLLPRDISSKAKRLTTPEILDLNSYLCSLIVGQPNLVFVDTTQLFLQRNTLSIDSSMFRDGLHLSPQGQLTLMSKIKTVASVEFLSQQLRGS